MTAAEVTEQGNCAHCGQELPAPSDGKWRWARGGKVHDSLDVATQRAAQLTARSKTFEFCALLDGQGRPRIASRRLASQP